MVALPKKLVTFFLPTVFANRLFEEARIDSPNAAIGTPVSWISARMIEGLLFEVPFSDGLTFAVTIATLTVVSAVAGYIPARRASRIDPGVALRS